MPPAMLWQAGTPCSRSQCTTFKLRTPWWQKTINVVSTALAFSCCKLAGMFRMGINVAPSIRVIANSSGSRTSISTSGSPASMRRWMSCGLVSDGRILSLTNLRIAQRTIAPPEPERAHPPEGFTVDYAAEDMGTCKLPAEVANDISRYRSGGRSEVRTRAVARLRCEQTEPDLAGIRTFRPETRELREIIMGWFAYK